MNMDRPEPEQDPLVLVKDVSKHYEQAADTAPAVALSHVDLAVAPGEFTALVGPSGSGKTTLLNLIGALDRPTSGTILLGGHDLTLATKAAMSAMRLRKIGFIFQDYNLLPVLSALENVEYILLLQGVPAGERAHRAHEALRLVGLDGMAHRRPAQLSGGQQQRVAVARAIAAEPMLILADEPTANLDSATGVALLDTMLMLNREKGVTFLFSTHDDMVMQHARRIVRMKDGQVVEDTAHAVL
jgi:putative ABC transport system ATP-binding protein